MKKVILVFLFSMVVFGVYGQQRPENRWILGRWQGEFREGRDRGNVEFVFNDNGTIRLTFTEGGETESYEMLFSINENTLRIFSSDCLSLEMEYDINRINDQRVILNDRHSIINLL